MRLTFPPEYCVCVHVLPFCTLVRFVCLATDHNFQSVRSGRSRIFVDCCSIDRLPIDFQRAEHRSQSAAAGFLSREPCFSPIRTVVFLVSKTNRETDDLLEEETDKLRVKKKKNEMFTNLVAPNVYCCIIETLEIHAFRKPV